MMALLHGLLTIFDSTQESWSIYIERLDQYFTANGVTNNDKKQAILLLAKENRSNKSYAKIITLVGDSYDPKPLVIV